MKTFGKLLLLACLGAYLIFAFIRLSGESDRSICRRATFTVADSLHAGFITASEAERLLQKSRLYPVGRPMNEISCQKIEETLTKNPFISSVVCYKTSGNTLNVLIEQRLPLLRVMGNDGDNYYLDASGKAMNPQGYVADLVVATGDIDRNFAKKHLVRFGLYFKNNEFWDNQIEQIYVRPDKKIELTPRVGDQVIFFGTADSLECKFQNLKNFYAKVMPQVGWNKYTALNVEHPNQIICKKRKTKK